MVLFLLWNLWKDAGLARFGSVDVFAPRCLVGAVRMVCPTDAHTTRVPLCQRIAKPLLITLNKNGDSVVSWVSINLLTLHYHRVSTRIVRF